MTGLLGTLSTRLQTSSIETLVCGWPGRDQANQAVVGPISLQTWEESPNTYVRRKQLAKLIPYARSWQRLKATWQRYDGAVTVALQVSGGITTPLKSWHDKALSRSLIRLRHVSSSHLPLLSSKKKGSKSRQMSNFLRYKYYFLNPNKNKPSLDPRNISFCYFLSIYFIILLITHIIAHCNSPYLLPLILNL